jgi:hypothetical protein
LKRFAIIVLTLVVLSPSASAYHLELEAYPAAVFPYFQKFGAVDLHVYPSGVRADTMWLDAFSRNGSPSVTVLNPLARMYGDIPIAELAAMISKLGDDNEVERNAMATLGPTMNGKVGKLAATRYRLVFGDAYIDYWTTKAVPENPQLRRIVTELVAGVSPGTAAVTKKIPGTPVYVELNFRRFKKVVMLRMKRLTPNREDEAEALAVGSWYMKAPFVDAIWK